MNLLLDIGNTRIKWAYVESDIFISGQAITHKTSAFAKTIKQQWLALNMPDNLAICSVSAKHIAKQVITVAQQLWPDIKVIIAKSSAQTFSVINAYPQPEKLGIDRWLGLIAFQHYYPGHCGGIIDCGTAITLDCINDNGQHLGGLISPGVQLMKQALQHNTEALPLTTEHYSAALSNTTEAAIYSGTLYAAAGFIEKTITDLGKGNTWILTGGDAHLLAPYLKIKCILDTGFVLKGLSLYCSEEERK